jgi:hypothetical protein
MTHYGSFHPKVRRLLQHAWVPHSNRLTAIAKWVDEGLSSLQSVAYVPCPRNTVATMYTSLVT